ncbi:MAG: hypothetical protein ABS904_00720 [Solibacillus isronensis]
MGVIIFAEFRIQLVEGNSQIVDVGMTSTNNDFVSNYIKIPTSEVNPVEQTNLQVQQELSLPELFGKLKDKYDLTQIPIFYYSEIPQVETIIERNFRLQESDIKFTDVKFINLCIDINPAKCISLHVPERFTSFTVMDLYQKLDKGYNFSDTLLERAFPKSVILRSLTLKLNSLPDDELLSFYNHFKSQVKDRHIEFIGTIYN